MARWRGPLAFLLVGLAVTASRADDPGPAIDTPSDAAARRDMVERQLRGRDIVDERVLAAMSTVPRHRFVPDADRTVAYGDHALPVGRGQTNAEIAAALHLSVPTVKAHVSRLLDKLDVNNRVQIALLVKDASGHQ